MVSICIGNKVKYAMLALKSYEQSNEFSVLSADELYFINGGSGLTECIQEILPPAITISDHGITAPFGNGEIFISGAPGGVSVGFQFSW